MHCTLAENWYISIQCDTLWPPLSEALLQMYRTHHLILGFLMTAIALAASAIIVKNSSSWVDYQ